MKKIGVGLIGCGSMGRELALKCNLLEEAKVVAVSDLSQERASSLAKELEVPSFVDYHQLLKDEKVSAVIIATPTNSHSKVAIDAGQAGKHIFCEKPMALSVKECKEMIKTAKERKVKLMIGQVLRFYPAFSKIIEMVKKGEIGKPVGIEVTRIYDGHGSAWDIDWRKKKGECGGLLMETNAHEIDFICCICGEVERVYAGMGKYVLSKIDYPDLAFVTFTFKSGALGILYSSMASAIGELSGKIQGEKGTIFYKDAFSKKGEISFATFEGKKENLIIGDLPPGDPVKRELLCFIEAIIKDEKPGISGEEGMRAVEIAQAAYLSAKRKEPVSLPL